MCSFPGRKTDSLPGSVKFPAKDDFMVLREIEYDHLRRGVLTIIEPPEMVCFIFFQADLSCCLDPTAKELDILLGEGNQRNLWSAEPTGPGQVLTREESEGTGTRVASAWRPWQRLLGHRE